MSDYTPSGNPVDGTAGDATEIRDEFALIQAAIATKLEANDALGTPASGVLTNCTGTAAGLTAGAASAVAVGGVTGLGTGVGTFLATPSSANLRAALADETGTGAAVFATSPTLVTPVLGVATATSVNGLALKSGNSNVGLGTSAFTTDSQNVAVGQSAAAANSTPKNDCVAVGAFAGVFSDGNNSVSVGSFAGHGGTAGATTSGSVLIGKSACYDSSGAGTNSIFNSVYIGLEAGQTWASSGTLSSSNNIAIGYLAAPSSGTASNTVTLGNSSIATLRCQVTSITALSDARDKTDVVPLPSGIDTVMALNPVRFTWNMRDGGKVGIKDAGFIAQDLQTVDDEYLRLVYAENPEKLEASYGRLIPVLVKAIQDLQQQINQLKRSTP